MRLLSFAMSPDRQRPASQEHTASQYLIFSPKLHEHEAGRALGLAQHGAQAWGLTSMVGNRSCLFPWPHLQPRAHICSPSGHEAPSHVQGEDMCLPVGVSGLNSLTLCPGLHQGETQPSGCLSEASGLAFPTPSPLSAPTLGSISLQGPLMSRLENGHALKKMGH